MAQSQLADLLNIYTFCCFLCEANHKVHSSEYTNVFGGCIEQRDTCNCIDIITRLVLCVICQPMA
jgi:hypothetical protein